MQSDCKRNQIARGGNIETFSPFYYLQVQRTSQIFQTERKSPHVKTRDKNSALLKHIKMYSTVTKDMERQHTVSVPHGSRDAVNHEISSITTNYGRYHVESCLTNGVS